MQNVEFKTNKYGNQIRLIDKINSGHVLVKFDNGYTRAATLAAWLSGHVYSPFDPTCQGVGYIGNGPYRESIAGKKTRVYRHWYEMIRRCYSPWSGRYAQSYLGCTVAEDWHNFQTFGMWFDQNYYQVDGYGRMELDKDILHPGNRIYSKDNCIFVPEAINKLVILPNRENCILPPGIREIEDGKYQIVIHENGKAKHLGIYYSINEATMIYCLYKQKLLKEFAFKFKDIIPDSVFNALYNYNMLDVVRGMVA